MPLPYCQDLWLIGIEQAGTLGKDHPKKALAIGIEQASTLGKDQSPVNETTLRKHWLPCALWDCRVLILFLSSRFVSAPRSLIQHSVQLPFYR